MLRDDNGSLRVRTRAALLPQPEAAILTTTYSVSSDGALVISSSVELGLSDEIAANFPGWGAALQVPHRTRVTGVTDVTQ